MSRSFHIADDVRSPDDADGRHEPTRRCLATGALLPKPALIRFVVSPDGVVTPDIEERLPGRGLWVVAERPALERVVARRLFGRAAKAPVRVPEDLVAQVEALLLRRCQHLLGMARRAGQAVAGFEKVRAWFLRGEAALLLAARDGAADGRRKLRGLAGTAPVIEVLDADELAAAFGRDRAVHVALAPGGLADRLRTETARLDGIRGRDGAGAEQAIDGTGAGAEDAAAAKGQGRTR